MRKSKFAAVALATVIALCPIPSLAGNVRPPAGHVMGGSTPWWMFICPADIVAAAMAKNWKRHRELTTQEAWSCGILYWWNEATGKYGR